MGLLRAPGLTMGAPNLGSIFVQRVVVGVGDLGVSNNAMLTLSTYALGSCVAIAAWASVAEEACKATNAAWSVAFVAAAVEALAASVSN